MALSLFSNKPLVTRGQVAAGETETVAATLYDDDGDAVNLAGATVSFWMRAEASRRYHVQQAATVTSVSGGGVSFALDEYETAIPGTYGVHFVVDDSAGNRTFYPGQGAYVVHVVGETRQDSASLFQRAIQAGETAGVTLASIIAAATGVAFSAFDHVFEDETERDEETPTEGDWALVIVEGEVQRYESGAWVTKRSVFGDGVDVNGFGVARDGVTDDTAALASAITVAATLGAPLDLGAGGTIKASPSTTIDLSGIPALTGDGVTLDLSSMTATTALSVTGSRSAMATGVAIAQGAVTLTVNTGLTLSPGDRVVITSAEATPNTARNEYTKGEPNAVAKYDSGTGALQLQRPTTFAYTSAYLWKITESALSVSEGVTLKGSPNDAHTCLSATYARLDFAGRVEGFGEKGVVYTTSRGRFTGIIESIKEGSTTGVSTEYGVNVNDLSEVTISALISAGRHAISGGGGGLWNRTESGGGVSQAAAYPSIITVAGGVYTSYAELPASYTAYGAGAIDAHGNVLSLNVSGATVFSGITSGARTTNVTGCTIYHTYCFGITLSDNDSTNWGWHTISDTTVEAVGAPTVYGLGVLNGSTVDGGLVAHASLVTTNLRLRGPYDNDALGSAAFDAPVYVRGEIAKLRLRLAIENTGSAEAALSQIDVWDSTAVIDLDTDGVTVRIAAAVNGVDVALRGQARNAPTGGVLGNGVQFIGTAGTMQFGRVLLDGFEATGHALNGVLVQAASRVVIEGGRYADNGVAGTVGDNYGVDLLQVDTAEVHGVDCRDGGTQPYGVYHASDLGGAGTLSVFDSDFTGSTVFYGFNVAGTVSILRDRGNVDGNGARRLVKAASANVASVAAGASTTQAITFTGTGTTAEVGRPVALSVTDAGTGTGAAFAAADWEVSAEVTAANTVTVTLYNRTGAAIDLRDTTFRVEVLW